MLDSQIAVLIQQIFTASLIGVWSAIALARVWIFLFFPILAWLWVYGSHADKHAVKESLWSAGLALLAAEIISIFFMRVRPFLYVSNIVALIPPPLTSSFPSSHTAVSFAIACALLYTNRQVGWIAIFVALGVACGRIAAGVHYPTDIIGGILIGLLSCILVRYGHKLLRKNAREKH